MELKLKLKVAVLAVVVALVVVLCVGAGALGQVKLPNFFSGNEYLQLDKGSRHLYFQGVWGGLGAALIACPPDQGSQFWGPFAKRLGTMTDLELMAMVEKYLQKNPTMRQMPMQFIIFGVISEQTWPQAK